MNELLERLNTYDWGSDRGTLVELDALIVAAQGDREKLAAIEEALLGVLQSQAPLPAKEYICRQLALIGTARCVPVLATMLNDAPLADRARFALEAIPDASADEALRGALGTAEGIARIGIVNTLGERGDQQAVPLLTELRNSEDKMLSEAAGAALRKLGPPA